MQSFPKSHKYLGWFIILSSVLMLGSITCITKSVGTVALIGILNTLAVGIISDKRPPKKKKTFEINRLYWHDEDGHWELIHENPKS